MRNRSVEPYEKRIFTNDPWEKIERRAIEGTLIVVDRTKMQERGLKLIHEMSRALLANDIHELIVTDQRDTKPGETVDNVGIIGFFEVVQGGVAVVGDEALIDKENLGRIAGFDDTHMPNHQNILIGGDIRTGFERGLKVGSKVVIKRIRERESNEI